MGKYIANKKFLIAFIWLVLSAVSGTTLIASGLYLYLSPKLPAVETLREVQLQTPLRIYSRDNQLIGEFGEKRRTPITYSNIPKDYISAILAAEDDQFYEHNGVSIKGLLRAASQLLKSGQIQSGGSTITMQVARNFFLNRKQTFARKFNEILLALQIERELTKSEILELYVNKIYLGNRAYGIQAAAQVYYGKDISELSLAQLAMIAGLPKAPSAYNPIINPSRALIRRNWILDRMLELKFIDQERHDQAKNEAISASYHGSSLDLDAPYIAEMARKEAVELFGEEAYTAGLKVYTTVNARLQAKAQQSVIDGLLTYDLRHGYRGPEQQLAPLSIPNTELGTAPTAEAAPIDYTPWLEQLQQIPNYGGLAAAAITQVNEQSAQALLADGSLVTLEWSQGLEGARRYINENQRGPRPKTAAEVVAIGDVVRLRKIGDKWHLRQIPAAQAALVALDPEDGAIISMVGGFDFNQSHFNRATQAARQPGSNFKPFIYTAALEHGFTPATLVNDAPIVFDDESLETAWRPENDSGKFYGPTRLRKALYKSRNLVSIRVLRGMGIPAALESLQHFGFNTAQMPHDLSLALGSYALPPLEVASGYTMFANGGYRVSPYLIDSIEDSQGNEIFRSEPLTVCRDCEEQENSNASELELSSDEVALTSPSDNGPILSEDEIAPADIEFAVEQEQLPQAPRVLEPRVAYIIDSMLKDVILKGTGRRARSLGRTDLGGKTGTTNGPRDAWFSGYNPTLVTTTWLGFDNNSKLGRGEYGGSAALPIWIDFMAEALKGQPNIIRPQPNGLVTVRINPETGKRAQPGERGAIFEIFRSENVPAQAESGRAPAIYEQEELPEDIF